MFAGKGPSKEGAQTSSIKEYFEYRANHCFHSHNGEITSILDEQESNFEINELIK